MGQQRTREDVEAFIQGVKDALDRPNEIRAQDKLDLLLLGFPVPPDPEPSPDPNCRDCNGGGEVCRCHGLPPFERGHHPFEACRCVRVR